MNNVYITKIAKFLPHNPVNNEEMETILGMVGGKPSKVKNLILRNNGIKTRYYAFTNNTDDHSYTNAEMTAEAVRMLFQNQNELNELDLITCGTSSADQIFPSHASMVHGVLGIKPLEAVSFAGTCNAGMLAFKHAYLSIATGDTHNAVCTGSERMSKFLTADMFEPEVDKSTEIEKNGYIAFEKDFLRWMLSDGAAAAYMQDAPNQNGISLKVEWVDIRSYAGQIETCMYSGGVKEGSKLVGYNDLHPNEWLEQSVFSIKQDTRLLGENIVPLGVDFLIDVIKRRNLDTTKLNWFLPHLSSEFFRRKIHEMLIEKNISIPLDIWFTNLDRLGNVGAASAYFMLEELMNKNMLKQGEKILIMVPESARFSYTYVLLTVV